MNHKGLVNRAIKLLKNTMGCRVVLSEFVAYTDTGETPDAIGWVRNKSILVECKISRADFNADKRKRSRNRYMPALGDWRFYLAPPDILRCSDIPNGWGLYEVHGKRTIHKNGIKYRNAAQPPLESDRGSEIAMLVSALSRARQLLDMRGRLS